MAKKKKSKFKKILKTLGKVAALGGAAYGASKLFGGKKGPVSTVGQPIGVGRVADMPANLGETFHAKQPRVPDRIRGISKAIPKRIWNQDQSMTDNNPMIWAGKKGGRVTGVAKRGFGRALMKGKK